MEIIEIQTHSDLRKAKSHLIYSSALIIAFTFVASAQFAYVFDLLMLVAYCYSFYAVYKFSKITNANLARYYSVMICLQLLGGILIYVLNSNMQTMQFWVAFAAVYVFIYICNIYLIYKMSYKMSEITDLPHFITSFKLYTLSAFCVIVAVLLVWLGLDTKSLDDGIYNFSIDGFVNDNMYLLLAFLCLLLVVFLTYCISAAFVFRGLSRMTYVKVRNA